MIQIKFKVINSETNELIGYERIGSRGQWEHKRVSRKEWLLGAITDGQEYKNFLRLQYTGLNDKNGKEGYYNDIINHEVLGNGFIDFDKKECHYFLNFGGGDWDARLSELNKCSIIGNKFKTPNLLNN